MQVLDPDFHVTVTGANGFLGPYLVNLLLSSGATVETIDGPDVGTASRDSLVPSPHDGARLRRRFIDLSSANSGSIIARPVDVVCHLAAISSVETVATSPLIGFDANVGGLLKVAESAARTGAKRLIFASSATVYGEESSRPLPENSPLQPTTLYAETKLLGEQLLLALTHFSPIKIVILRLAHLYGPTLASGRIVANMVTDAITQCEIDSTRVRIPVLHCAGRIPKDDFLYVADAAAAFFSAVTMELTSSVTVLNISTGNAVGIDEVATEIATALGVASEHELVPISAYWNRALDNSRASRLMGWTPAVDLDSGIRATVEGVRALMCGSSR